MPGDDWRRFANLRLLLGCQYAQPGKKLLFMGTELGPWSEWNHEASIDWHLREDPSRAALERFVGRLNEVYKSSPVFWREDPSWDGFNWIDVSDKANSVISYVRRAGESHAVVVLNLTPVPRDNYRIGVPQAGEYLRLLSSDDTEWGGSGYGAVRTVKTTDAAFHGYSQSLELTLPPLAGLVLTPA
jgi:1,4-alpha-glucan branching enzyme